mmetsp:Transcript_58980/g.80532  ORF Transcript_58980/g.80532 Transcript_58980/m.80532 type:complete len:200 (+) Transcript_58980:417-1016(+)
MGSNHRLVRLPPPAAQGVDVRRNDVIPGALREDGGKERIMFAHPKGSCGSLDARNVRHNQGAPHLRVLEAKLIVDVFVEPVIQEYDLRPPRGVAAPPLILHGPHEDVSRVGIAVHDTVPERLLQPRPTNQLCGRRCVDARTLNSSRVGAVNAFFEGHDEHALCGVLVEDVRHHHIRPKREDLLCAATVPRLLQKVQFNR